MSEWKVIDEEEEGGVLGKLWVTNGKEEALFKPDSKNGEGQIEKEVYEIAKKLGISCAKTEIAEIQGKKGVLSYNFKTDHSLKYQPASDMCEWSYRGNYSETNRDINAGVRSEALSVDYVSRHVPAVEAGMVDMLFLDCLINNSDRHGENWEVMVRKDDTVVGMAPLFDHGMSMQNSEEAFRGCSRLPWKAHDELLNHFDMFEKLCIYYPKQVSDLMNKGEKIEFNDFVKERFQTMQGIRQNIERTIETYEKELPCFRQIKPETLESIMAINKQAERAVPLSEIKEKYHQLGKEKEKHPSSLIVDREFRKYDSIVSDLKNTKFQQLRQGVETNHLQMNHNGIKL